MHRLLKALLLLSLGLSHSAQAIETITYYHLDAQGSPVAATNEQGQVIWREYYTPYGERLNKDPAATPNTRWYTGHPHDDDTGLTYMGARYYDPTLGRFMAIDPAPFTEDNLHSFNRYAYANNNPYRYVDPDGRNAVTAIGGLLYETGQALSGNGFNGSMVLGGLADGYNGGARDFAGAAIQDATALVAAGALLKVLSPVMKVARGETAVIGRVKDLQNLKPGEKSLLDRLPDQGSPKANWKQNSGVLRQEMNKGKPIRDASPDDMDGPFLNAERYLLKDRGWTFDSKTNYWNPPAK